MDKNFIFARPIKWRMATYKKRGFKPKNKAEEAQIEEHDSTTAEVFNTLDESASKTEEWVQKNQNYILGVIGVIAVGVLAYLGYHQFIQNPKEIKKKWKPLETNAKKQEKIRRQQQEQRYKISKN